MDITGRDGGVVSMVTADALVVVDVVNPLLPARSLNVTEKAATPSGVLPETVRVALHTAGPPVTVAEPSAIVTVGVWMLSEAVNASVIISPTFASAVLSALLEDILLEERDGGVVSGIATVMPFDRTNVLLASSVQLVFV